MNAARRVVSIPALVMFALGLVSVAAQTAPSIQIVPTPVGAGRTTTVYGRDFCNREGCSTVTISMDSQVLTSELEVTVDGTFQFAFIAPQLPDQYRVTARQSAEDGSTI